MKITALMLPAAALGTAAILVLPGQTRAFTTIGGQLGLGQRDFRMFNNFGNAGANNNTTEHPMFPGYDGAEMAFWKACVEWGSELHGDGTGDSHQPTGLGSGGANFDPSFQGNSNGTGGTNANIASEISGCGGGTLAYMEGPIGDGWRIRFCGEWNWSDGPSNIGFNQYDIQGVGCHEYGHALGLGHTNVGGATMWPSTGNGQISARSINADDKAGVQFVYGVIDAVKPTINSYTTAGNSVTIFGERFTPTDNDVWFTQLNAGGNGTPVKVENVDSAAGGTQITVTIPADAGSGDILVKSSETGGKSLSNAFPFELPKGDGSIGTRYCEGDAVPNSTGVIGRMTVFGSVMVSDDNLTLSAGDLPTNSNIGYFIMGEGLNTFTPPGSAGPICVAPSIKRYLPPVNNTNQFPGGFDRVVGTSGPVSGLITPTSTWAFQAWHRDSAAGTSNLTDAVSVDFQ